jgi:predicted branched-subunit amino acid permease
MSNTKIFREGVVDSMPICISFAFLFSAVGVLNKDSGYSLIQSGISTATIFAAPLQSFISNKIASDAAVSLVIATALANFRFGLMSAVMKQYFLGLPRLKILASMLMLSASTYAVTQTQLENRGYSTSKQNFSYYLGVSLPSYAVAIAACLGGYIFMSRQNSPFIIHLFLAVLPIHFAALTAKRSADKIVPVCTAIGMCAAPVVLQMGHSFAGVATPLLVGFSAAWLMHRKSGGGV